MDIHFNLTSVSLSSLVTMMKESFLLCIADSQTNGFTRFTSSVSVSQNSSYCVLC